MSCSFLILPLAPEADTKLISQDFVATAKEIGQSILVTDINCRVHDIGRRMLQSDKLFDFFITEQVTDSIIPVIEKLLLTSVEQTLIQSPLTVGLYLPTPDSQHFAKWLSYYFRKLSVTTKIIVSGPGCIGPAGNQMKFVDYITNIGFVTDYYPYHIQEFVEQCLLMNVTI